MKGCIKLLIVCWAMNASVSAQAGHYNPHNLIDECKQDDSFESKCFTYLAAYRDLLWAFVVAEDDAKRAKLLCLLDVPTKDIARHLKSLPNPYSHQDLPDFLVNRFCN